MNEPTAMTELHPSRRDPLRVGQRVRLHSGRDAGTVTEVGIRIRVRWDSGQFESMAWEPESLVILAEQA